VRLAKNYRYALLALALTPIVLVLVLNWEFAPYAANPLAWVVMIDAYTTTIRADGYSKHGLLQLREGQNSEQVLAVIGPPLWIDREQELIEIGYTNRSFQYYISRNGTDIVFARRNGQLVPLEEDALTRTDVVREYGWPDSERPFVDLEMWHYTESSKDSSYWQAIVWIDSLNDEIVEISHGLYFD